MLKETFWMAYYSDNTRLLQYEPDGSENKYTDIDRRKLTQFILFRSGKPLIVIHLDGNKKLIYRMRRAMNNKGYEEAVFLAGWQERISGRNTQMIMFLFEDNHIEIVDRFYENHLWFYSINFLPDEKT
jgi:hypothetical protein